MKRILLAAVLLVALATTAASLAAATTVTINTDRRTVNVGGMPMLNGTAPANSNVTITADPMSESTRTIIVKADPSGIWKLGVHPWVQTTYRATVGNDASSQTIVFVKPRVELIPKGRGRYQIVIAAGRSFAGHSVLLSKQVVTKPRHWVSVKRIALTRTVRTDGTTIGSFTYRARAGTPLKVLLEGKVAEKLGYVGATSNVVVG